MNLSETVFVLPPVAGGDARVRLFTTWSELDFAGHPILGTACILAANKIQNDGTANVVLETPREAVSVTVTISEGGSSITGWMRQPIPSVAPWPGDVEQTLALLNVRTSLPVEVYDNGIPHMYIAADSIDDVLAIEPDFAALRKLSTGARFNVFAGADTQYTSRMFTPFDPAQPEDPACGSAAGPLALHLVRHRRATSGGIITISQGEKVGRLSTLLASASVDGDLIESVLVGGSCVRIGEGSLFLQA